MSDELHELLEQKKYAEAKKLAGQEVSHHNNLVYACCDAPDEVLDAAVDAFIASRTNYNQGSWVHSLSHFTQPLWEKKRFEQLKKLYKVAFDGARETGENSCIDRLFSNFTYCGIKEGLYTLVPAEYSLTPENAKLLDPEDINSDDTLCALAAPFADESAYLLWEAKYFLGHPKGDIRYNDQVFNYFLSVEKMQEYLATVKKHEPDNTEFDGVILELLKTQVSTMKAELKYKRQEKKEEFYIKNAKKAVELAKSQLEEFKTHGKVTPTFVERERKSGW